MSGRKKHADNDDNIKIYPDIVPGLSHSVLDTQIGEKRKPDGKQNPEAKSGGNIRNSRGWSK